MHICIIIMYSIISNWSLQRIFLLVFISSYFSQASLFQSVMYELVLVLDFFIHWLALYVSADLSYLHVIKTLEMHVITLEKPMHVGILLT